MPNYLNHSPADVVRSLLIQLGLGSDLPANDQSPLSAWSVYKGAEPSAPDNVLTVTDTVGRESLREMVSGRVHSFYGFQVRIRSADPDEGFLKADAIRKGLAEDVLRSQVNVETSVYFVQCISRIGAILPLGWDTPTTKRSLFTINATLRVRTL